MTERGHEIKYQITAGFVPKATTVSAYDTEKILIYKNRRHNKK